MYKLPFMPLHQSKGQTVSAVYAEYVWSFFIEPNRAGQRFGSKTENGQIIAEQKYSMPVNKSA